MLNAPPSFHRTITSTTMGFFFDFLNTVWPGKSKFDPARDIPDLSGKVFIVTGSLVFLSFLPTEAHIFVLQVAILGVAIIRSRSVSQASKDRKLTVFPRPYLKRTE